jgi:hypothetical protein
MKHKIIFTFLLLFLCTGSFCFAGDVEVPKVVKEKFEKQYSDAKNASWFKLHDDEYEVEFTRDGKNYEASYKANGEWRETGMILSDKEIPVAIRTSFGTLFPDAEMLQVTLIENGVRGSVYEVEYKDEGKTHEVYLKPDGDKVPDFSEDEEEKYDRD